MLFDTHCHLDDPLFAKDVDLVIDRAREAGVTAIVTAGTSISSSRAAIEIARRRDGVWAAGGIHPNEPATPDEADLLAAIARDPKVVAIGETGLDFFRQRTDPFRQQALLEVHLKIALDTGKPLIFHCRDAHAELYERLASAAGRSIRGVMHCFSGTPETARRFLDLGLYISIAGPVTYPAAEPLRALIRTLPLDRLLVETDAPYLPPQEFRGGRNEPAYVRFTARRVARAAGVDFEKLCEVTTQNGRRLFGVG